MSDFVLIGQKHYRKSSIEQIYSEVEMGSAGVTARFYGKNGRGVKFLFSYIHVTPDERRINDNIDWIVKEQARLAELFS